MIDVEARAKPGRLPPDGPEGSAALVKPCKAGRGGAACAEKELASPPAAWGATKLLLNLAIMPCFRDV